MKAKYAKGLHFPGWLFLIGMSVYVELLLHFWVSDRIVPGRLAAVVTFALAFGSSLGFLASLLPAKGEKWVTVILATLMAVPRRSVSSATSTSASRPSKRPSSGIVSVS